MSDCGTKHFTFIASERILIFSQSVLLTKRDTISEQPMVERFEFKT
jgi:hypothetical protein